jgi:hypothetical protein
VFDHNTEVRKLWLRRNLFVPRAKIVLASVPNRVGALRLFSLFIDLHNKQNQLNKSKIE